VEQILFITANPKTTEESTSLSLGKEFLKAYKEAKPEDEIAVIDLAWMPHIGCIETS